MSPKLGGGRSTGLILTSSLAATATLTSRHCMHSPLISSRSPRAQLFSPVVSPPFPQCAATAGCELGPLPLWQVRQLTPQLGPCAPGSVCPVCAQAPRACHAALPVAALTGVTRTRLDSLTVPAALCLWSPPDPPQRLGSPPGPGTSPPPIKVPTPPAPRPALCGSSPAALWSPHPNPPAPPAE